jgi:hypothetical protein
MTTLSNTVTRERNPREYTFKSGLLCLRQKVNICSKNKSQMTRLIEDGF